MKYTKLFIVIILTILIVCIVVFSMPYSLMVIKHYFAPIYKETHSFISENNNLYFADIFKVIQNSQN